MDFLDLKGQGMYMSWKKETIRERYDAKSMYIVVCLLFLSVIFPSGQKCNLAQIKLLMSTSHAMRLITNVPYIIINL